APGPGSDPGFGSGQAAHGSGAAARGPFPADLAQEIPRMVQAEERLRRESPPLRFPADLTERLDRLSVAHVCAVLRSAGIDTTPGAAFDRPGLDRALGTVPGYRKFVDALLAMLADDGLLTADGERLRFTAAAAGVADPDDLTREILADHPEEADDLAFLAHCVRHYREVLGGTTAGTEVLLPDGSDDRQRALIDRRLAYSDIPVHRRLIAETVARLAAGAAGRTVRVLEIGAGRGYLTWEVAEALRAVPGVEYHVTDLGRSFVLDAQRRAAEEGLTALEFGVLDVTRDPAEQGYAPGTFDIVLAFNVLHATPDLRRAVRNAGSLLGPDGVLLLLEASRQQRWSLMTTGLYEGWWYFDDDLRRDSPLIAPDRWAGLLGEEGFADVTAIPRRESGAAAADHTVVVARRPSAAQAGPTAPPVAAPAAGRSFNRRPELSTPYEPPRTDREKDVVRLWEEVLGIDGIGVRDNFFDLGGESLLAMQLLARLRDATGTELSLHRIFDAPTVAELVPLLDTAAPAAAPRIRPSARRGRAAAGSRDQRME
ncbi:methyltransferase, partial [Streptomyces sp. URMC 123]|uniref:methyltransferase n=1 Tax=Streptomyces sp. URMC 123 TaxID=3423403 RepID=UPI003F1D1B44